MPLPCVTSAEKQVEPTAVLEALLFLSGQPMTCKDICSHTGWEEEQVERIAQGLENMLQDRRCGLMILRVAGGYQLVTKPVLHESVQWTRTGLTELTPPAMEVLSIVAFKQPVTRADIEKLRGVSSERVLGTLVQEGLVAELGRKESPGRPILYGTTAYFLECIGMDSLTDLEKHMPPLQEAVSEKVEPFTEDTNGTVTKSDE